MATTEQAPAVQTNRGAHLADPAALGLGGFALTTFVLSVANTNVIPIAVTPVVFGLALAYGGIAQFAAGIWEFAKGNTFGATAFCSYGGFWISYWYLTGHTDLSGAGASVDEGVGLYLLAWAIFTGYMTIAATKTNTAVLTVFVLLTITYILLAIGNFATSSGWIHIGGWVGVATALAAWYASMAVVANFTHKKTLFPVGPLE